MQTRWMVRVLVAASLATALAGQAATNVYRWIDKDGKVHFSDTPPPEEARSVSQRQMGGGYVEEASLPYATQIAMKRNPVTLYTANGCKEACDMARDLLSTRGIPYTEHSVRTTADAEALRQLAGATEVPFLMVGQNKLRGYAEEGWQAALDEAGYPRTRLPGQRPTEPAVATPAPVSAAQPNAGAPVANGTAPAANPPAR